VHFDSFCKDQNAILSLEQCINGYFCFTVFEIQVVERHFEFNLRQVYLEILDLFRDRESKRIRKNITNSQFLVERDVEAKMLKSDLEHGEQQPPSFKRKSQNRSKAYIQ
jgi:hypothetical protein